MQNDHLLTGQLLEGLANIYESQRRYDDAITALRHSVEVSPDRSQNASKNLARLLEDAGQLEEARDILESLGSQYDASHRGGAWGKGHIELQLAGLYAKLGQPDLAATYYTRSIQHLSEGPGSDPAYPAVSRATRFFLEEGLTEEAVAVCVGWKLSLGVGTKTAETECHRLAAND